MDNYKSPETVTSPSEALSKASDDGIFASCEITDNSDKDREVTSKMLCDMHHDIAKSVSSVNGIESVFEFFVVIEKSFQHNKQYSDYFGIPPAILACKVTALMMYQSFARHLKEDTGMIAPCISTNFCKKQGQLTDTSLDINLLVLKSEKSSDIVILAEEMIDEISNRVTNLVSQYGYSSEYSDSVQITDNPAERFEA